eukprot:5350579-Pyramimonas_sp.AAC.1
MPPSRCVPECCHLSAHIWHSDNIELCLCNRNKSCTCLLGVSRPSGWRNPPHLWLPGRGLVVGGPPHTTPPGVGDHGRKPPHPNQQP